MILLWRLAKRLARQGELMSGALKLAMRAKRWSDPAQIGKRSSPHENILLVQWG